MSENHAGSFLFCDLMEEAELQKEVDRVLPLSSCARSEMVEFSERVDKPKSLCDVIDDLIQRHDVTTVHEKNLTKIKQGIEERFPNGPDEYPDEATDRSVYEWRYQGHGSTRHSFLVMSVFFPDLEVQEWFKGAYTGPAKRLRNLAEWEAFGEVLDLMEPIQRGKLPEVLQPYILPSHVDTVR